MHNSLVEILREDLGGAYVDMQEIVGGMDRLPNAFFASLDETVRLGANVFAIDQEPDGVTVHYKTESGRFSARGDFAIVTIPFAGRHPLAIGSHFFEFIDANGCARLAHQLERGVDYTVVVTTGGGLYRYRLADRVSVDGWCAATPSNS